MLVILPTSDDISENLVGIFTDPKARAVTDQSAIKFAYLDDSGSLGVVIRAESRSRDHVNEVIKSHFDPDKDFLLYFFLPVMFNRKQQLKRPLGFGSTGCWVR